MIAMLCVVAYEAVQTAGWRFDLFLLMPLYAIIGLTWVVRVYGMARRPA